MNYTDFTPEFIKQFKARLPKELPFSLEVTKGSDITGSVEIRDQYSIIATVNGKPYYVKEKAQFIVDACNTISDALEEIEYLQAQVKTLRKEK
jgi:hypothetical protein